MKAETLPSKVVYLTLEAPREGQASYVHVHEIINGLKQQGVGVRLYEPSYTSQNVSPRLVMRLFHAVLLQLKLWFSWKKGSVLYVRAHYLAFPSALTAKILGIPIFQEINGPYEDVFVTHPSLNKFRKFLIPMQRVQYKWARGVIAVTRDLQAWVNREGKRSDCAFISNGANVEIFKPDLHKPSNAPENYVVFFGGLTRWHGVDVMLEAVSDTKWPEGVKLLVIGEGQETPAVESVARQTDQVVYLGRLSYLDVASYVAHSLAGLVIIENPDMRSSTGVLPLKLYETLACGVPVIATDLPGQADLVKEHDCGYIIPVSDSQALALAVSNIASASEDARDRGARGRDAIVKHHSWFARSQQTLTFMKDNLKGH